MKENFNRFYGFIRAFNFCFGLMLLVFAASIGLTIYFHSFWYLLLAALDVAFYLAFYLIFSELLDYASALDEIENLEEQVDNIKQLVQKAVINSIQKEDEIDFNSVNKSNKF